MDSLQLWICSSKTYCYICAYITHLRRDYRERIIYFSAEQLPDDGLEIEHDSNLLPFIHEPCRDPFLHPSDHVSCDTEADRENACIDQDQAPVRTRIDGTLHLDNHLTGKPSSYEYFNIMDDEIDQRSPFPCQEGSQLALR